jgi:hypothetical protein
MVGWNVVRELVQMNRCSIMFFRQERKSNVRPTSVGLMAHRSDASVRHRVERRSSDWKKDLGGRIWEAKSALIG